MVSENFLEHPVSGEEVKKENGAARGGEKPGEELYRGTVELLLEPGMDLPALARLSKNLEEEKEIEIVRIKGSWDNGATITIQLDKPLPLMGILSAVEKGGLALSFTPDDSAAIGVDRVPGMEETRVKRIKVRFEQGRTDSGTGL